MESFNWLRSCGVRARFSWLGFVFLLSQWAVAAQPLPTTVQRPVTNSWGVNRGVDPFQWLEPEPDRDSEVGAWTRVQRDYARAQLAQSPLRPSIQKRLSSWVQQSARIFRQFQWTRDQAFVLVADSYLGPSKLLSFPTQEIYSNRVDKAVVIVSPLEIDASGLTDIRWFAVSPDVSVVAVLLGREGEHSPSLHFWDIASGRKLPDILSGVAVLGRAGSAAWTADSKALLYSSYTLGERASARVMRHALGQGAGSDVVELASDIAPDASLTLQRQAVGPLFVVSAQREGFDEQVHWVRDREGRWRVLAGSADHVEKVAFGRSPTYIESPQDDSLYLLSRARAPHGRILRVSALNPTVGPRSEVVVVELTDVIADFAPSASGFYLSLLKGGRAVLSFYDRFEKEPLKTIDEVPVPVSGQVSELYVTRGDEAIYRVESFVDAAEWRGYDPNRTADKAFLAPMADTSPEEFLDVKVDRIGVKSADGTRIPLFVIRRNGMRATGESPTLLTGYGAAGVNRMPDFDWTRRLWLDQLGVIAVAQLRGGGEMGAEWRADGRGLRKGSVIEDLAACARVLVQSNYTRPNRLAILAQGHGGLAAAALAASQPERLQALVLVDPVGDLMRAAALPGGSQVMPEYGSPEDPAAWPVLARTSPYILAETARSYPAVLIQNGAVSFPVSPAHSRKMTARWQASTTASRPILYVPANPLPSTRSDERTQRWVELMTDRFSFLCDQLSVSYSLVERGPWSGGVRTDGSSVRAKLVESNMVAHLLVSDNRTFTDAVRFGPARSEGDQHNLVGFESSHLKPDTQYHYVLEVNGRVDWASRGQFRTFPVGPASFQIAFGSCAKTASANESFDRIREHHPLFFMNMGDFHYLNISSNSIDRFRRAYDLVLSSLPQSSLYREVPFAYIWDDHDYGGNNSNRKSSSHTAVRQAYAEYVPHYPLASGGGDQAIYQSFTVGRVKFILTDLRSERDDAKKKDDASKSMMGVEQKAWFKKELLEANGKYPLICWMSSVPWIGDVASNYYGFVKADQFGHFLHTQSPDWGSKTNKAKPVPDQDHWSVYSTERREIADFIKMNGIKGLCILHGDSHMLAADDGRNADYATGAGAPIPTMCAGPLDQTPSLKGGPYSQGVYKVKRDEGCFGLLEVTDRGVAIDVHFSGRNNHDLEKMSLRFSVPASPSLAAPSK